MAWIELHQAIWTHRKTLLLATELDLDETYAVSHVIRLWTWALDNAPDGDMSTLPAKVIAFGAAWRGDPNVFVEAAINSGWLDREGDTLKIHDWHDYAGRLIEKRRQDAERKRQWRGQNNDVRRTSSGRDVDSTCDGARTVPNLTVPNLTNDLNNDSVDLGGGMVDQLACTEAERKILHELKLVPGYPFDFVKDLDYIRSLVVEFPTVDITSEIKKWHTYKLDNPLKKKSNPRLQFRNWLEKAKQWLQEKGVTKCGAGRQPGKDAAASGVNWNRFQYRGT